MLRFFVLAWLVFILGSHAVFADSLPNDNIAIENRNIPPGAVPVPAQTQQSPVPPSADSVGQEDQAIVDPACTIDKEWLGRKITPEQSAKMPANYRVLNGHAPVDFMYVNGRVNIVVDNNGIVIDIYCG